MEISAPIPAAADLGARDVGQQGEAPATGARRLFRVAAALLRYQGITMRRYYFNTIMALVGAYLFFFMIFMGAWAVLGGQPEFQSALSEAVVRMLIWMMAIQGFSAIANTLSAEAGQGTLEQLAMSPFGLGRLLLVRSLTHFVVQLGLTFTYLFLMMATTRQWLHIDLASMLPLMLLTVLGATGIGFVMGGAALLFKRMQSSFGLLQYLFIALIAVPPERFEYITLFPLALGADLLCRVMIDGVSLLEMPGASLGGLVLNSGFYLLAGFAAFRLFERRARTLGVLGHY
jgi:ABC-2 type transport system permease protein